MENKDTVLVTGGSGAIAIHCIQQLLQKGFTVRTTLRSLKKKQEIIDALKISGTPVNNLSFFQADLTSDSNWDNAIKNCRYVLHIASPTHIESSDEKEMIGPAVDGAIRVLRAANNANVKRVVLTSSFGAVGFSRKNSDRETTENDWTDTNQKNLSAYEKSKGLAEAAAWGFVEKETSKLELSVINPVAVFGPALSAGKSPSLGLLTALFSGSMKAVPNIPLNVVDIRDVADLHIRAMITPEASGERFIASADGETSLPQIAKLLKKKFPVAAINVSLKIMPDWLVSIAAIFNSQARQASALMKINRKVSNEKAKKILGWKPIGNAEDAVIAAAETMIKFDMIK